MKKVLVVLLAGLTLIGCGERSELEVKLDHQLAMEREKTRQIAAQNQQAYPQEYHEEYIDGSTQNQPTSRTTTTMYPAGYGDSTPNISTYSEGDYVDGSNSSYTEPTTQYGNVSQSLPIDGTNYNGEPIPTSETSGYSGTSMVGAALVGAAAGYAVSNNKEVIKEKSKVVVNKAKATTVAVMDKTKSKYQQVKASPKTKSIVKKVKYQARKAKVVSKKQYRKVSRAVKRSSNNRK